MMHVMKTRHKIVFTIPSILSGGAEVSLYDILKYMDTNIFDVTLIAILQGDSFEKKFDELPNIKIIKLGFKNRYNPLIMLKLRKFILDIKPDIVHTNLPVANIYTRFAVLFLKTKLITTFHSPVFKKNIFYLVEKLTSRYNDWIIANSAWSKKKLIENSYISENKIKIIQLGIDLSKFQKNDLSKSEFLYKYHVPENSKIITYVASFKPQKGHQYLLKAIKMLHETHPDFYFFLVGSGELFNEIKEKSIAFGLSQNIIFTGTIHNVSEILEFSDLFVSPSLAESFGIALVEAMYFKVPIVAFGCDAVPEIVMHDYTGLLVDIYDTEGLKNCILKVLNQESIDVSTIVENAFRMATEKLSIENTVKKLESFYIKLMTGH